MPDPATPNDPAAASPPPPDSSGGGNKTPADGKGALPAADGGGGKPQRPEAIPEQFWDEKTGAVKTDDLGKSFTELAAFKAGIDSLAAQRPETPDGYKLELPKEIELPAGLEFKPNPEDARVKPLMEWAHKHGLSQEAVSELYGIEAQSLIGQFTADKEFRDAEMQKLGEKGADRVKAASDWIDAQAPDKEAAAAGKDLLNFADGVRLFENLIRKISGPTAVRSGAEGTGDGRESLAGKSWEEKSKLAGEKAMALIGRKRA